MSPSRPHRPPRTRALVALALTPLAALVTGCMTGERPSFNTAPTAAGTATGDANIDAVLARFDAVGSSIFTATYTATLVYNGTVTQVSVSQAGPERRSVTIGDVRFLTDGSSTQTCVLPTGQCTDGINAQAVSNTGVTADVATGDMAKRLRRSADAKLGPTVASTPEVAGQPALCVDVPLSGGTAVYCALAGGAPARFSGGDLTLELTSYAAVADEAQFATSG